MHQINFLIVGRGNFHKPLILMAMDQHKDRLCFNDYKDKITRTYRQLMLLQLQGFMLWAKAFTIVNRDSSIIADRYTEVLKKQTKYLQDATCPSTKILYSTNFQDCTGGFYIQKSMKSAPVSCKDGYFPTGMFHKHPFFMFNVSICKAMDLKADTKSNKQRKLDAIFFYRTFI